MCQQNTIWTATIGYLSMGEIDEKDVNEMMDSLISDKRPGQFDFLALSPSNCIDGMFKSAILQNRVAMHLRVDTDLEGLDFVLRKSAYLSLRYVFLFVGSSIDEYRLCSIVLNHARTRLTLTTQNIVIVLDALVEENLDMWRRCAMLCKFDRHFQLGLRIGHLENNNKNGEEISKWKNQPVKHLILSTDIFLEHNVRKCLYFCGQKHSCDLTNASKEAWILPLNLKDSTCDLIRNSLESVLIEKTHSSRSNPLKYVQFIYHLMLSIKPLTKMERFSRSCIDRLQTALQPLSNDLQSQFYETFEKDTVKYDLYQEAIRNAFMELKTFNNSTKFTVLIPGVGRGPVIQCVNLAAEEEGVQCDVTALEKNQDCFEILNRRLSMDHTSCFYVE
ncbi:hypothetical protein ACOME3_006063 [Neoechinorhynchus agilis]